MFSVVVWFNNILNSYVIYVQSKTWVHIKEKFQMFLWTKLPITKAAVSSSVVEFGHIYAFVSPGARKGETMTVELFPGAPHPPSVPANVFWIVYSNHAFLEPASGGTMIPVKDENNICLRSVLKRRQSSAF